MNLAQALEIDPRFCSAPAALKDGSDEEDKFPVWTNKVNILHYKQTKKIACFSRDKCVHPVLNTFDLCVMNHFFPTFVKKQANLSTIS